MSCCEKVRKKAKNIIKGYTALVRRKKYENFNLCICGTNDL